MRNIGSPQSVQLSKDGVVHAGTVAWQLTDDYRWTVSIECAAFDAVEALADDAFEALCLVREQLEPLGWRIGVAGAQLGVWPSGMARDQGGGQRAYRQTDGQVEGMVDTFEAVDPATVTTVAEQQADVERQHGARMRARRRVTHVEQRNGSQTRLLFAPPTVEHLRKALRSMNGSSRWAFSLWRAPADANAEQEAPPAEEYMQCAGSAAAMTVEVRFVDADGTAHQHVIGRAGGDGEALTEAVTWDDGRHETMLRLSEVLTADEAAEIFAAYAATDGVAEHYTLRELDLRWPSPGEEAADAEEQDELITVELWREDAHPGDQGERTATFEVPARLPLSALLARVIEPFLADAPRTGWVCRGTSRGDWRAFAEVVTHGAPDRLGTGLLVRNHSIRSFVGAAEDTFRVACGAPLRSGVARGAGPSRPASRRPLLFTDGEDVEQRWAPSDERSAQAAFWEFVRERQPEGQLTFAIEDDERDEGIMILLGADAIGRATADPEHVEFRAVPEFGDYFALVSTFVSGGFTALERHGPWLPDQHALAGAQLRIAMDESSLRRTHPLELRRRLAVLTRVSGGEPVTVDGVTHYGYAQGDGSTVDAWFAADGRGLLVTNDRTSPLSASPVHAVVEQLGVPAAVLALAGSAPATGVFTFAGPCALADGLVSVLQDAEVGLAATGVERLVDPFLEIEAFTPEAVAATAEWWSADDVGGGFAAAAESEAVQHDASSLDGAAVGVLRRAWATTGFFDRWDVHWVLFDSCTLEQAGDARGALLQAIATLGLELVDSPPGSAAGEVWVRTDPRIGLGADGGVDAGSTGEHPDAARPLDPVSEPSCATCDSALVRSEGRPPHDIDIEATTEALQDRVAAGRMREVVGDVPLADMIDLFAADMKYTIVSFLECLDCTRLLEWGLAIRGAAIFRHVEPSLLDTMRWSEVPPRLAWVGAASFASLDAGGKARERRTGIARHEEAMRSMHRDAPAEVVDARAGEWALLRSGDDLLLATKRSGSERENSLLLRLDERETADHRRDGAGFLDDLASRVRDDPSASGGAFDARDLYRGRGGPRYRALAAEAMRAWKIRQPRPGACEICTSSWVTHVGGPVTIGESESLMGEVRRCRSCGAYWDVGAFSYPQVISRARALRALPDLARLEAELGIGFPEPPPFPPDPERGGRRERS